jgi:hypothetical protein
MNSGFKVGDGWYDLIYRLSQQLEQCAETQRMDPSSEQWPAAIQVKSKFGTLKFYCRTGKEKQNYSIETFGEIISIRPLPSNEHLANLILTAEKESKEICEDCGEKGSLRMIKFLKTLCDNCYKKRLKS